MSFATPEMTGRSELRQTEPTPVFDSFSKTCAQVQGVRFPVINTLPMHTSLQNTLVTPTSLPKTTSLGMTHGIAMRLNAHEESAPVTMKFKTTEDLAQMLFPTSDSNGINLQHMHEGLVDHTSALNTLAKSTNLLSTNTQSQLSQLSGESQKNHKTFHTALLHHTDVMQHLADESQNHHLGLEHHTEVIEHSLKALKQQNLELTSQAAKLKEQQNTLSSFQTLLRMQAEAHGDHNRTHDVHARALDNHMQVLNKHVGMLKDVGADMSTHSEALEDHRDHIQTHAKHIGTLQSEFKNFNTGLLHHTAVLKNVHTRQNDMDARTSQIMSTQTRISENLQRLDAMMKTNNQQIEKLTLQASSNTEQTSVQNQILSIKKAVNDNAQVLKDLADQFHSSKSQR